MRAPYGPNILENCVSCPVRGEHLFCNLSLQAAQRLNDVKSTAVYPKGAIPFIEGQQPRGVFVLSTGRVKLTTSSREGKTINHEDLGHGRRARAERGGFEPSV